MLKEGRNAQKGHRMELVIIQLWLCLCWLVPIAAELVVRRLVPATPVWQSVTLFGSFLLNRLLLAPAHTGYYACCRRLASATVGTAATCEIENLREELIAPTLLRCFFLDYRHPVKSLKWQLRWDALRFFTYGVLLFPALFFAAVGADEETALMQAICGAGSILFAVIGLLCGWLLFLRLRPILYYRPQHGSFFKETWQAWGKSRKRLESLTLLSVKRIAFTPAFLCPLLPFRTAFHVEQAALFMKAASSHTRKRSSGIFHTRVLRDA